MSVGPELSLILPCYNEMGHIERSLREIAAYLEFVFPNNYEIILVDDCSTDGTRDFLNKVSTGHEYKNMRVELNTRNLGRGGAVKRGLQLARGSVCGFMDIDREVSEVYIPKFVQCIKAGADIVVASRIYKVSLSPRILLRHVLSQGYRMLVRALLRTKALDSEAGYKFFSERARRSILELSRFDDWFWDTEVTELCALLGYRLAEVPTLFIRDGSKTSTVRVFHDVVAYLRAISNFKALLKAGKYTIASQDRRGDRKNTSAA